MKLRKLIKLINESTSKEEIIYISKLLPNKTTNRTTHKIEIIKNPSLKSIKNIPFFKFIAYMNKASRNKTLYIWNIHEVLHHKEVVKKFNIKEPRLQGAAMNFNNTQKISFVETFPKQAKKMNWNWLNIKGLNEKLGK